MRRIRSLLIIGLGVGIGCSSEDRGTADAATWRGTTAEGSTAPSFVLRPVEFRGPPSSGMPYLSTAPNTRTNQHPAPDREADDGERGGSEGSVREGRVLMSWHEKTASDRWALRMAERRDDGWTESRTVAERDAFFVNWADFPSITALENGSLLVHWLEKVAEGPYAYHVRLALSRDGGESWSEPLVAHRDDAPTEHGFVSVVPWGGGAALVWLDGRAMDLEALETHRPEDAEGPAEYGAMTLRARTLGSDGTLGEEQLLDDRTCECCTTSLARTADGLIAAYRDRSPEEIRDIYVTRFQSDNWTEPRPVSEDGWYLPGCPVNGPQLASDGDRVVVSWFTAAEERPRVYLAFSEDGGESWADPIRVDEGRPLGRVDVELLGDGSAAVAWIETAGDVPRVLVRGVDPAGAVGPALVVTEISAARSSGFPRMARAGDELLVAWTDPGPEGGVRVRAIRTARVESR